MTVEIYDLSSQQSDSLGKSSMSIGLIIDAINVATTTTQLCKYSYFI